MAKITCRGMKEIEPQKVHQERFKIPRRQKQLVKLRIGKKRVAIFTVRLLKELVPLVLFAQL
jgi:hypothetical protein